MPKRYKVSVDFFVEAFDEFKARDHVAMALRPIEDMINDGFVTGTDVVRLQSDALGVEVSDAELEAARNWQPDDTYFQGVSNRVMDHAANQYWSGR